MEPDHKPPDPEMASISAARTFACLTPLFASGQLRPNDELRVSLDRVERYEADVQAFAALWIDAALSAAAASDERWRKHAPLSGIRRMVESVKDIIETRDMPTGQGRPIWAATATYRDSACAQAMRESGGDPCDIDDYAISMYSALNLQEKFAQVF
jgi:Asp-tRNA(Asn)/Glu-tRNA(Gln) amidotransferase A subunit family amidase